MEIFKPDININFIGRRWIFITISLLLIIVGTIAIYFRGGLNPGIDFAGGTLVEIRFVKNVEVRQVRDALRQVGLGKSEIQHVGSEKDILVKTELSEKGKISERITTALAKKFEKKNFEILRVEMVGPAAGEDLRYKAQSALLYSIIGMIIYISYRFQNKIAFPIMGIAILAWLLSTFSWMNLTVLSILALIASLAICIFFDLRQAFAAIVALIHDVTITLGFLAITNKEFSLPVLAAILTLIGYSINDTIVVFDRIRENLSKKREEDFTVLTNSAINQTLSRTILTSGLTLLAVISLFIFGGPVIHDFSFTLLVGIIVGTYSSDFIASPILVIWERLEVSRSAKRKQIHTLKAKLANAKNRAN